MMPALYSRVKPDRDSFLSICNRHRFRVPPLYIEVPYKPPIYVYEPLRSPGAILLESIKGHEKIARYSFVSLNPYKEIKVKDSRVEVMGNEENTVTDNRPLSRIRRLINSYQQLKDNNLPPFQGGAVGLLSYDFAHYLERLPRTARDDLHIPDAHFFLVDRLFAFDHLMKKAYAVICPGARDTGNSASLGWSTGRLHEIYSRAEEEIAGMLSFYEGVDNQPDTYQLPEKKKTMEVRYETTKQEYMDIVMRAKKYIRAGDIFQSNLSQRLSAELGNASPWTLYRILRTINPSPFSAYADFGDYQIASSSPERLIRLRDGVAETRPIAGTRPRGSSMSEDERLRADLLLNEKERAEHIMLIDLERNDLGRVCSYGTVKVDELMTTEDYSHVIHIVSNVRGVMAEGRDAFSLIRATFPGGTITGVPKVRCMEIIDELEPLQRGPYTGSLGYICFSGDMDLNIIIRTFVIKGGRVYVQAGAGIVADSDPEREYYETLKKAEALLSTLDRA